MTVGLNHRGSGLGAGVSASFIAQGALSGGLRAGNLQKHQIELDGDDCTLNQSHDYGQA